MLLSQNHYLMARQAALGSLGSQAEEKRCIWLLGLRDKQGNHGKPRVNVILEQLLRPAFIQSMAYWYLIIIKFCEVLDIHVHSASQALSFDVENKPVLWLVVHLVHRRMWLLARQTQPIDSLKVKSPAKTHIMWNKKNWLIGSTFKIGEGRVKKNWENITRKKSKCDHKETFLYWNDLPSNCAAAPSGIN